jgi:hypothetical protein
LELSGRWRLAAEAFEKYGGFQATLKVIAEHIIQQTFAFYVNRLTEG